jgi:hypothetical protein
MTLYTLAALLPLGSVVTLAVLGRRAPRSTILLIPGVVAVLVLIALTTVVTLPNVPTEVWVLCTRIFGSLQLTCAVALPLLGVAVHDDARRSTACRVGAVFLGVVLVATLTDALGLTCVLTGPLPGIGLARAFGFSIAAPAYCQPGPAPLSVLFAGFGVVGFALLAWSSIARREVLLGTAVSCAAFLLASSLLFRDWISCHSA